MPDKVDLAIQNQIKNIQANTGKSMAEWTDIARKLGSKHGEIVKALKEKHGISHGNANRIALIALQADAPERREIDQTLGRRKTGRNVQPPSLCHCTQGY